MNTLRPENDKKGCTPVTCFQYLFRIQAAFVALAFAWGAFYLFRRLFQEFDPITLCGSIFAGFLAFVCVYIALGKSNKQQARTTVSAKSKNDKPIAQSPNCFQIFARLISGILTLIFAGVTSYVLYLRTLYPDDGLITFAGICAFIAFVCGYITFGAGQKSRTLADVVDEDKLKNDWLYDEAEDESEIDG